MAISDQDQAVTVDTLDRVRPSEQLIARALIAADVPVYVQSGGVYALARGACIWFAKHHQVPIVHIVAIREFEVIERRSEAGDADAAVSVYRLACELGHGQT